jgi:hypothetical protein
VDTQNGQPDPGAGIAANLLRSSQAFARSGVRAYADEEWEVFHLHLATAIEQLVKSVLARANPLFIADARSGFDTLLRLSGMAHRASTPASAVRTVTATEALERVRRLLDPYQEPGAEVRILLETRNAIVHGGASAQTTADVLLGECARYIQFLLDHAGTTSAAYWGDLEDLVQTHMDRRLTEIEGAYQRRLQAARGRFAELSRRLEDEIEGLRTAVQPSGPSADFSSFPATCPACDSVGTVYGSPSPDWEADWDYGDGMAYVAGAYIDTITLDGAAFDCRVCGLSLYGPLLDSADIGTAFKHGDDFDLDAASDYFSRQYFDDDD